MCLCVFVCMYVTVLYPKRELHVGVCVSGGLKEWGGGRVGVVERRLLSVVFVDGARSSVSGEVEWLVPANHGATGEKQ